MAQLTLSLADSPASPGAAPGTDEALTITEISGRKCAELLPLSGLDGSLQRMCRALMTSGSWGSIEHALIWRASATQSSRLKFRLVPLEHPTDDSGCGLWPTACAQPDNKTPDAHIRMKRNMPGGERHQITDLQVMAKATSWATPTSHPRTHTPRKVDHGEQLANQVALWSTPRATDGAKGGPNQMFKSKKGKPLPGEAFHAGTTPNGSPATTGRRSALNPAFVCWLMGYPAGWLRSVFSGTRSSRRSSKG